MYSKKVEELVDQAERLPESERNLLLRNIEASKESKREVKIDDIYNLISKSLSTFVYVPVYKSLSKEEIRLIKHVSSEFNKYLKKLSYQPSVLAYRELFSIIIKSMESNRKIPTFVSIMRKSLDIEYVMEDSYPGYKRF